MAAAAIRIAFHPTPAGFARLIDRFLADRQRLITGPYVPIAMLFHRAPSYLLLTMANTQPHSGSSLITSG